MRGHGEFFSVKDILEFSIAVYGNGDQGDDSSLLMHELEFVPLDMASKYPTNTNSCSHLCLKSLVFCPRRLLPPPYHPLC